MHDLSPLLLVASKKNKQTSNLSVNIILVELFYLSIFPITYFLFGNFRWSIMADFKDEWILDVPREWMTKFNGFTMDSGTVKPVITSVCWLLAQSLQCGKSQIVTASIVIIDAWLFVWLLTLARFSRYCVKHLLLVVSHVSWFRFRCSNYINLCHTCMDWNISWNPAYG